MGFRYITFGVCMSISVRVDVQVRSLKGDVVCFIFYLWCLYEKYKSISVRVEVQVRGLMGGAAAVCLARYKLIK